MNASSRRLLAALCMALLAACGGGDAPTANGVAAVVQTTIGSPTLQQASVGGAVQGVPTERAQAVIGGSAFPAVAAGDLHTLALKADGTV